MSERTSGYSASGGKTRDVFVTGATGYIGRALIARLLERGHRVRALARRSSTARVPPGAQVVVGDALAGASYAQAVAEGSTLVHLVGTPNPNPSKAAQFRSVDLASAREAVRVARDRDVGHFVYVSVAQPAPVMKAYVHARAAAEWTIAEAGLTATILRPWYVLGPGHWWPIVLLPGYWFGELVPGTRETARRLGLVTLRQMVASLARAIEDPPASGSCILDVPAIRAKRR